VLAAGAVDTSGVTGATGSAGAGVGAVSTGADGAVGAAGGAGTVTDATGAAGASRLGGAAFAAAAAFFAVFLTGGGSLANFSLRRLSTGASTVEEAERTNSPMSFSMLRTVLLSTPSSFASS
jgi:hypothetical protein